MTRAENKLEFATHFCNVDRRENSGGSNSNTGNDSGDVEGCQATATKGLTQAAADVYDREELMGPRSSQALGQPDAAKAANYSTGSGNRDDPALGIRILLLRLIGDAESLLEGIHDD